MPSYQMSSSGMAGVARASRCRVGGDGRLGGLPCPSRPEAVGRAATTRLAASRWTSHSNGPGSVSSKSRRSKARFRSGVAHSPKLRTWASPHSWTSSPLWGREPRSAAMTAAAPR